MYTAIAIIAALVLLYALRRMLGAWNDGKWGPSVPWALLALAVLLSMQRWFPWKELYYLF
jgi:hypothetical protein